MTEGNAHILVVDDDPEIRRPLAKFLSTHGFRTSLAADGKELDRTLATSHIDLIVLDIMMPGEDGFSICRRLRGATSIPVILLTAMGEDIDRIIGLELGADDYVAKPFNPRELVARIKAVLRRADMLPRKQRQSRGIVKFDRWLFDLARNEVRDERGAVTALSSGEHVLLVALIAHAGMALSRDQLLDLTKGRDAEPFERSIDNQISRLRRKVEADSRNPQIILTKWGGGYIFAAELEWLE